MICQALATWVASREQFERRSRQQNDETGYLLNRSIDARHGCVMIDGGRADAGRGYSARHVCAMVQKMRRRTIQFEAPTPLI